MFTYGIALSFTSNFRLWAETDVVGDRDDVLFHDGLLLSNVVAIKLFAPVALCNDVDIADGTWFDVDEWTLWLTADPTADALDVVWLKWLGNCELFSDVDIKFVVAVATGATVTWFKCEVEADVDCVTPLDWASACTDNWHGDFGECALFDDIEASADVDEDNELPVDEIEPLNAMEDECNGFTIFG